ncbi:MAG: MBL fold metallo-hydrolase, partial [Nitrososphaera sp.]
MRATFYGHVCLKVASAKGAIVLMDPWFSRHGAFFGSWFQFPENTPLLEEALEGVNDICVSHNHFDHFDPLVLLSGLAKNPALKLHIARFQT